MTGAWLKSKLSYPLSQEVIRVDTFAELVPDQNVVCLDRVQYTIYEAETERRVSFCTASTSLAK